VPVTPQERFVAVQEHRVDLLCGEADTLTGRKQIAFSIPTYPGGLGAMVRADAPPALKEVLTLGHASARPLWRATPAQILSAQTISVVAGSATERWVATKLSQLEIPAKIVPVSNVDAGIGNVVDRKANVMFAERSILLAAATRAPFGDQVTVLDRRFTYAPVAIGLAQGEDDLRLVVDRTLSRLFVSTGFRDLYTAWFGQPDQDALRFFSIVALPE
jgi:ABC-type amino acid transport substrate-binding protein